MKIGSVIHRWRTLSDQDLRSVAEEIGISSPTLMRLESGKDPSGETIARVIRWLFDSKVKK